ncbi:hypothetical protein GGD81_001370 [Rhodobium orientis]|uniref:hypothetical protein n=1 Tax=Rhodobium orientis TaxID=34017 RepID=UPI0011B947DB|nr:hypothetical protein [Rhodobium orientis]MBB4302343.1 hypothetical protein [Rhodobium orientis]
MSEANGVSWPQAIAIAVITSGLSFAGGWWTFASKDRELDIKMVEVALSILRSDPEKSPASGARTWAMDILDQYSGVTLTPKARAELQSAPVMIERPWGLTLEEMKGHQSSNASTIEQIIQDIKEAVADKKKASRRQFLDRLNEEFAPNAASPADGTTSEKAPTPQPSGE